MIYTIVAIAFGAVAVLCLVGAWLKRSKRMQLGTAFACALIAALSAESHVFWPVGVFGLMVPWALFTSLNVLSSVWRLKVGLTLYIAIIAGFSLYPTYHDELLCPDVGVDKLATLRPSCPKVTESLDAEQREKVIEASAQGDKGFNRFLLANIPFRMVRGLDLKGGLRLVYTVAVHEAIKDRRDRYYDALRAQPPRAY